MKTDYNSDENLREHKSYSSPSLFIFKLLDPLERLLESSSLLSNPWQREAKILLISQISEIDEELRRRNIIYWKFSETFSWSECLLKPHITR